MKERKFVRKIIQVSPYYNGVVALCDDGSVWAGSYVRIKAETPEEYGEWCDVFKWNRLPDVPQTKSY